MTRYRGRHRKPTHTGRNLAAISASGAFAVPTGLAATATPAEAGPPGGWGAIIACESGGNARVQNSSSTASGLFQFLDSTWRSVGGSGRAKDASVAEQYRRAEILYAQSGTTPWNASRSCWAGRTVPDRAAPPAPARAVPQSKAQRRATPATTRNTAAPAAPRAADGSGTYRCGPGTYLFEACDPGMDGQVKQYPPYNGRPRPAPVVNAAQRWPGAPADLHRRDHTGRGSYVCDTAHLGYEACDVADLGDTVAYPLFTHR